MQGPNSTVSIDFASGQVFKRLSGQDEHVVAGLVRHEFDCLKRYSRRLEDYAYLRCPAPISCDQSQGLVQMQYCSGERLDHALAAADGALDAHLDHIADQLATGLLLYLDEFDEPYFDLGIHNVLYDRETRIVSLVDFSSRRRSLDGWQAQNYLDVSIGSFIGISLFWTVRPSTWMNGPFWRSVEHLSKGVIDRLGDDHPLNHRQLRSVSRFVYKFTALHGRLLRQAWYQTAGRALFIHRRHVILSATRRTGTKVQPEATK